MPIIIRRSKSLPANQNAKEKHFRITINDSHIQLRTQFIDPLKNAFYILTKFPKFGHVYLNQNQISSFNGYLLNQGAIFYRRIDKFAHEHAQDEMTITECSDWPECHLNLTMLHFQINLLPVERRIEFKDLIYKPPNTEIHLPFNDCGTFHLIVRPQFGLILADNVEITQIDSTILSKCNITYYRPIWNISNIEFVFERIYPPLISVFRIITHPLIRLKTLYVPYGKEFVLTSKLIDISALQDSVNRLKNAGVLHTTTTEMQRSLTFVMPHFTPIGKFSLITLTNENASALSFTYMDLTEEKVRFSNFPNASIRSTLDDIKVSACAPAFMTCQQLSMKISIMSTGYNAQENILLSDFVDQMSSIDSPIDEISFTSTSKEPGVMKLWFALGIGLVCFIVCIFVTASYFLLRRWRSKRRIQVQCNVEPIVYTDHLLPLSTNPNQPSNLTNQRLPSSLMMVPLSVFEDSHVSTETTPWNKPATTPLSTICFINTEELASCGECGACSPSINSRLHARRT